MAKFISAGVGRSAPNRYDDVRLIQYLLNCVPTNRGGPMRELVVDGVCGPLTMQAISGFQRAQRCPADGRVDPGGPTFRALAAYDPYPQQPLPMGNPGGKSSKSSGSNPFNGFKLPPSPSPDFGLTGTKGSASYGGDNSKMPFPTKWP